MLLSHVSCGVSTARACFSLAMCALLAIVATSAMPADAADWPPVVNDSATARIEDALEGETTFEFIETPLANVVAYLKDLHVVEIQIDGRTLEGVDIGEDTPVTHTLRDVSLRSALNLMLKELDLTFVVRDEVILITTPEEAGQDTQPRIQVYNVQPLLDEEHGVDELIDTVTMAFEKESAVQTSTFRGLLVVRGTSRQQRDVRRLLGVIGAALDVTPPKTVAERDRERPMPMGGARGVERVEAVPVPRPVDRRPVDPFGGGGADESIW